MAVLLFACVPVLIKYISANIFTIGIVRLAVATSALWIVSRRWRRSGQLGSKEWLVLAQLGLLFGLHWLFFFWSIKISTASVAILSLASYGIHLLFLGWIFGGTKPTWVDFLAVLLAFFGNALIIPALSLTNETSVGVVLGILSGFFFACLPVIHRKHPEIPTVTRTSGQFVFAFILFLFFLPETRWHLAGRDWLGLLVLSVFCTFVAHTLWVHITTHLPTVTTSLIYYLIIPVALLLSFVFLGETMSAGKWLGAVFILAANLLGLHSQWRRKLLA